MSPSMFSVPSALFKVNIFFVPFAPSLLGLQPQRSKTLDSGLRRNDGPVDVRYRHLNLFLPVSSKGGHGGPPLATIIILKTSAWGCPESLFDGIFCQKNWPLTTKNTENQIRFKVW